MPRKFFRKYLPQPEEILAKPWAAPFRPWLAHPNLWHLNRRSVPGAVAIGLFCGLIPGPLQMLGALLACVGWRKNIPVALVTTLYTNPITIVPLYVLAYGYGRLLLGERDPEHALPPYEWTWSSAALWEWMLGLGQPLAIGLLALASTLALLGYCITALGWRFHVSSAWRSRKRSRR